MPRLLRSRAGNDSPREKEDPRNWEASFGRGQAMPGWVRGQLPSGSWTQPLPNQELLMEAFSPRLKVNVKLGNKMPSHLGDKVTRDLSHSLSLLH